ncbi:MAG: serine hydrolase domain-containing protein [Candidatus Acidiferrales bacterium]|jgi:D-alanyl-D-alanine carboxypeptidase
MAIGHRAVYRRLLLFLVMLRFVCPRPAFSQTPTSGLDAVEEAKIAKLLADSGVPSVSIAVVDHGQLAYAKAFGKASLDPDRTADAHTRYAVGSVSKQFTAAAILLIAEQGKLSLDDKVSKYFPDLTRANEITIRELLSHTSGYEDYAPQDYMIPEWIKPTTPEAVLDQWAKKPLDFDPGTRWQYSNTNYVLAGRIFEKASGRRLMPFLKEKFFDPLGMTTAGDCSVDKTPEDAVAYTRYALGPARPALREGAGWYFAAGELCMTPSDLATWDSAFLHKRILSAQSYAEFTKEVLLKDGNYTHYALGLQLAQHENIPVIYHGGEVSGFLTLNQVFPTRDAAVIVCSNEDSIGLITPVANELANWVLKLENTNSDRPGSAEELQQVRSILEGLQKGQVDRALFTSDMIFYLTPTAVHDIQSSLSPLGSLKSVTRTRERFRGGMTFRAYNLQFDKKSLILTVYLTSDGHYEQFLIMEEL